MIGHLVFAGFTAWMGHESYMDMRHRGYSRPVSLTKAIGETAAWTIAPTAMTAISLAPLVSQGAQMYAQAGNERWAQYRMAGTPYHNRNFIYTPEMQQSRNAAMGSLNASTNLARQMARRMR